ncbi:Lebercilin domain-containing protein [Plasmodiophora brassicae]|uniref:Uncharacterized protein n=1 Tax=Plasmodiophora brassicae TaxID=37360 RepID=A0A0G4J748_PLABS|nr:hypothetical protein PBRA_003198 [Plasmodiophora brassicae]SPQ95670.1 unnamed protein product [Plasmodiophora brassicae]
MSYEQRWSELEVRRQGIADQLRDLDWKTQRRESDRGRIGVFYRSQLQNTLAKLHKDKVTWRRQLQALDQRVDELMVTRRSAEDRQALRDLKKHHCDVIDKMKPTWIEHSAQRAVERLAETQRQLEESVVAKQHEREALSKEQVLKAHIRGQQERVREMQAQMMQTRAADAEEAIRQEMALQEDQQRRATEQIREAQRLQELRLAKLKQERERLSKEAQEQDLREAQLAEEVAREREKLNRDIAERNALRQQRLAEFARERERLLQEQQEQGVQQAPAAREREHVTKQEAERNMERQRTQETPKTEANAAPEPPAHGPVPDGEPLAQVVRVQVTAPPQQSASVSKAPSPELTERPPSESVEPAAYATIPPVKPVAEEIKPTTYASVPRPSTLKAPALQGLLTGGLISDTSDDDSSPDEPAPVAPSSAPAAKAAAAPPVRRAGPTLNISSLISGEETDSEEPSLEAVLPISAGSPVADAVKPRAFATPAPSADEFDF